MAKQSEAVLADGERVISDKSRANPIPASIKKIKGLHHSAILYKCEASSFWQFRVYLEGKLRKRSTQEIEFDQAQRKAKLIFAELVNSINSGETKAEPTSKKSLDMVAKSLWAKNETRIKNEELNKHKVKNDKYVYEKHIKPFFARYDIKDIDADLLEQFKGYLAGKDLSATSQLSYIQVVMSLLAEAQKKRLIAHLPPKPRVRTNHGVRGYFNDREYAHFMKTVSDNLGKTHELIGKDGKVYRRVTITVEIYLLISFMVETYIRPTDIKVIRHKDVHVVTKGGIKFITLRHEATKGHKKQMTSTERGYDRYMMLKEFHGQDGMAKPEDYLFLPQYKNRDTALDALGTQFTLMLEAANLRKDEDGKPRTLYSLRHTAIVHSIRKGLDLEIIASNARTSTDMIRRFYGSHVDSVFDMGDAFFNAEKTKRDERYDFVNDLAKEINFPFDAYEESPEADAEHVRDQVSSLVRKQARNVRRGGVGDVSGGIVGELEG